jgi:hypothetical protein
MGILSRCCKSSPFLLPHENEINRNIHMATMYPLLLGQFQSLNRDLLDGSILLHSPLCSPPSQSHTAGMNSSFAVVAVLALVMSFLQSGSSLSWRMSSVMRPSMSMNTKYPLQNDLMIRAARGEVVEKTPVRHVNDPPPPHNVGFPHRHDMRLTHSPLLVISGITYDTQHTT